MQPDAESNNSEELVKSTEETLSLTLNKQYQGNTQADGDDARKRWFTTSLLLLKCCNSVGNEIVEIGTVLFPKLIVIGNQIVARAMIY